MDGIVIDTRKTLKLIGVLREAGRDYKLQSDNVLKVAGTLRSTSTKYAAPVEPSVMIADERLGEILLELHDLGKRLEELADGYEYAIERYRRLVEFNTKKANDLKN